MFTQYVTFIRHAANESWTVAQLEAALSDSEFPKAHVEVFGAFWKAEREKVRSVQCCSFIIDVCSESRPVSQGARCISAREQVDIFLRPD